MTSSYKNEHDNGNSPKLKNDPT